MKPTLALLFSLALGCALSAQGLKDLQKKASGMVKGAGTATGFTEEEAARALKEAFSKGTEWGVAMVSKENGYFGNPKIKIPFPPDAQQVESRLRSMGMNALCDNVVLSVNRAAEDAGPQAKAIFLKAIQSMTLNDAIQLIKGGEQSGTDYLKKSTRTDLVNAFKPIVQTSLDKVGATRFWTQTMETYNKIPLVQKVNPDLVDFATQKAVDGLFTMVAEEERKIRKDPLARSSELLKKVFGSN
ncbi:MAG: DUF4197 domain-containing protein [Bacteroidetes bacterium]|nr:DUF4197 domain-containing protein [Bacteroidota bacterium]